MQVVVKSCSEESLGERDYQDILEIHIDGVRRLRVSDGEPEDNTLSRNFSDCFAIVSLMKSAYEAGKAGDTLDFVNEEL